MTKGSSVYLVSMSKKFEFFGKNGIPIAIPCLIVQFLFYHFSESSEFLNHLNFNLIVSCTCSFLFWGESKEILYFLIFFLHDIWNHSYIQAQKEETLEIHSIQFYCLT